MMVAAVAKKAGALATVVLMRWLALVGADLLAYQVVTAEGHNAVRRVCAAVSYPGDNRVNVTGKAGRFQLVAGFFQTQALVHANTARGADYFITAIIRRNSQLRSAEG